ncbi:MAG: hypothetical protein BWY78_01465 [Alphaproteobacteria bacterium ADurb.Bin438]|nr:MAG: hypothetical protein BWY78_01465 [Alphaproteobacteria bacterium ADurb.Bin438]
MMALILSPLFMVAFVFPSTKTYTKKGWTLALGMCFQLIFTVTFISFAIISVRTFGGDGVLKDFMDPAGYDKDDIKEILEGVSNGREGFFDLMFASFFLLVITDKISDLAKDFSGAPATKIVSSTVTKFGGLVASGVTAAVMIAATGGAAAAGQLKKMGGKALNAAKDTIMDGSK